MKNNKGASLIFIIACIAIVTVIGLTLLVVTTSNREMKRLEKKAQEAFYEAEEISDELVIVLETLAQDAVAEAYTDLWLQYTVAEQEASATGHSALAVRTQRYCDYFAAALQKKINEAGTLQTLFEQALELAAEEMTGMTVTCGGIVTEPEPLLIGGSSVTRKNVRMKDVTLSFTMEDGYQTKIVTDICLKAKLPEVDTGTVTTKNRFREYGLLTGGDIVGKLGSNQPVTIRGNVYTGGGLFLTAEQVDVTIEDAAYVLVKDAVTVDKAKLTVRNHTTEPYMGMWADGIDMKGGGSLSVDANCYIADDLELEGNGTYVVVSGTGKEYVGYSGGTGDTKDSSAVIVNQAKNITLDFSGLTTLSLTGNAYIKEDVWENASGGDVGLTLGVLQGESIAYKEMQMAYLVPGECLKPGHNPMQRAEFLSCGGTVSSCVESLSYTVKESGVTKEWDLTPYLDATEPVISRYVQYNGGSAVYVYLYLNFASEQKAAEYFRKFLQTETGQAVANQVLQLNAGSGRSYIRPAQNNLLQGNGIAYDEGGFRLLSPVGTATERTKLLGQRMVLKDRRNSLFYALYPNAAAGYMAPDYEVLKDRILNMDALRSEPEGLQKKQVIVNGVTYDLFVYNGEGTVCSLTEESFVNGMILVNGKLNLSSSNLTVNGLVIATEGVEFSSGVTINANGSMIDDMLSVQETGKYFAGYEKEETSGDTVAEVVEITFENWRKN